MSAHKDKEEEEGLGDSDIWRVYEIGLGESLFERKPVLLDKNFFLRAKVQFYLHNCKSRAQNAGMRSAYLILI